MTAAPGAPGAEGSRTRHRLHLPRDTEPAAVLAMVRNVRPAAHEGTDGQLELGDGARLVPDRAARGTGRWILDTPRVREDPVPAGMADSHGFGRAFPEGLPFAAEREALDLVWSLARRLHGSVLTDDGARLAPHPFHVRDLTVVSPHALAPESLGELLAPLASGAELDEVPAATPRTGYSATLPLPAGDAISVRVGPSSRPTALAALDWLEHAVDYELVHLTADPEEDALETPDAAALERWRLAYERIGTIAGLLVGAVGGFVVDLEGFLVDPADLA